MTEYTIITETDELNTDDYQEALDYWEALTEAEQEEAQYFAKTWTLFNGEWRETGVEILG